MNQDEPNWDVLGQRLGYEFQSLELVQQAFVHESLVNETEEERPSNERLEFLGDSVLGLVVAEYLFRTYPDEPEGKLAQMKSYLVSKKHLAICAEKLKLGEYLQLGRGEETSGGKRRRSLLANSLEAVLGAIFIEGGFAKAKHSVLMFLQQDMDDGKGAIKDSKSRLQEKVQTMFQALPEYEILEEEGPPHHRTFLVEVRFAGEALGRGQGLSKREASQIAAQTALKALKQRGENWYEPYLGKLPRSRQCL